MKLLMSVPKPTEKENEDTKKVPPVAAIDLIYTGGDDDDDSVEEGSSLFTHPHSKVPAKKPAAALVPTTMAPPPKVQTNKQFGMSATLSNIMAPMPCGMDSQFYQTALASSTGLARANGPWPVATVTRLCSLASQTRTISVSTPRSSVTYVLVFVRLVRRCTCVPCWAL